VNISNTKGRVLDKPNVFRDFGIQLLIIGNKEGGMVSPTVNFLKKQRGRDGTLKSRAR
jgi:hypothetical protein